MLGDPKHCRMQAAECLRLADTATSEKSRDDFNELAKIWLKLAGQFESDQALVDAWGNRQRSNLRRAG